jgi:hypothetical protein
MTIGPDGSLYVSNLGFAGPGAGQILKVDVSGIARTHPAHGHGHAHGHTHEK